MYEGRLCVSPRPPWPAERIAVASYREAATPGQCPAERGPSPHLPALPGGVYRSGRCRPCCTAPVSALRCQRCWWFLVRAWGELGGSVVALGVQEADSWLLSGATHIGKSCGWEMTECLPYHEHTQTNRLRGVRNGLRSPIEGCTTSKVVCGV